MDLKCPLSVDEQISKLMSHGIIIDDLDGAKAFLQQVSYYRLTGYTLQFIKTPSSSELASEHKLSEIRRIYDFDAELRSLIRHYIEILEVHYKTHISNTFALEKCKDSPHDQHYDPNNYYNKDGFKKTLERFQKEEQYYVDSLIVKHPKKNFSESFTLHVCA